MSFKRGRAPSMIQMRLLQTIAIPTPGPKIADFYENVYGYEVNRGTIYATLSTMHERGWVTKWRDAERAHCKVYHLTKLGVSVLVEGVMKYARVAEASRKSVRRAERFTGAAQ